MSKGMLIDITKCIGCFACVEACRVQNNLPEGDDKRLSATTYTTIESYSDTNVRRFCMHCRHPSCASACPVGALSKTDLGPVVYDQRKCLGCRYCMVACPFNIPKYEWNKAFPRVRKCFMCADRVTQGRSTACAEACLTGATLFGDREEILATARNRIRTSPAAYVSHIYGEEEAGGTSILFIAPRPFESLGFPATSREPYPAYTWAVMSNIPPFVAVWGSVLTGLWWFTERKNRIAADKGKKEKPS